jgi:hypothetical protein
MEAVKRGGWMQNLEITCSIDGHKEQMSLNSSVQELTGHLSNKLEFPWFTGQMVGKLTLAGDTGHLSEKLVIPLFTGQTVGRLALAGDPGHLSDK